MRIPLRRAAAAVVLAGLLVGQPFLALADELTGEEFSVPEKPGKKAEPSAPVPSPPPPGTYQVSGVEDVGYRIVSFLFTAASPAFLAGGVVAMAVPVFWVPFITGDQDAGVFRSYVDELAVCPFRYTFLDPWRQHEYCPN